MYVQGDTQDQQDKLFSPPTLILTFKNIKTHRNTRMAYKANIKPYIWGSPFTLIFVREKNGVGEKKHVHFF